MIFLETDRLVLRQVEPKDVSIIFDYRNHPDCAKYQRGQTKSLEGIQELIARRQNDTLSVNSNCLIAVALKTNDELVGEIVVMPNDGCFSLGYTFSYRHHRKGFAFEALSVLMQTYTVWYPEQEFICFVEPENRASIALLKKLGYADYGYVEKITSNMFGKWMVGDALK